MKKKIKIPFLFTLLIFINPLFIMAKKAEITTAVTDSLKTGKTWAVVVGISKYKNRQCLNYADKDAIAFYNYLVNMDGGPRLDTLQVRRLLNDTANCTNIFNALNWLRLSAKENDRVIFYFSGHGAVEEQTINQNGFLLAYDAPTSAIITSGSVNFSYIQQYLDTYIVLNRVKEDLLIVDACFSGKLSDGNVGSRLITQTSGVHWNNQIFKILSGQESEYSQENIKWGYGRGAFSYFFMKGIEGMADQNNDNLISLNEIDTYLKNNVPKATYYYQYPKVDGDLSRQLFSFNQSMLKLAQQDEQPPQQLALANKGQAEDFAPSLQTAYKKYLDYVRDGRLLWGKNEADTLNCAKYIYEQLVNKTGAEAIQASLNASFLTELMRKCHDKLDDYLKGKNYSYKFSYYKTYYEAYREMDYLKTLIKPGYILYNYIMARANYMHALFADNGRKSIELNKQALQYEKDAPYILNELGYEYNKINKTDSAIYYLQKASLLAPRWAYPYYSLGTVYDNIGIVYDSQHNYPKAVFYLKKAIETDSTFAYAYNNLGNVYFSLKKFDTAFNCYQKAIKLDSTNARVYDNIGLIYRDYKNDTTKAIIYHKKAIELDSTFSNPYANLGYIYQVRGKYDTSLNYYKKAIQLDSTNLYRYINLGNDYMYLKDFHNAISAYQKAVTLDTALAEAYADLGYAYINNREFDKGVNTLQKALKLNPDDLSGFLALAEAYSLADKSKKGLEYLKRALQKGYKDYESIITDENMNNLKKQPEFNLLMKQYFPDKIK